MINLLGKVSTELDSATDSLELVEAVNLAELGVVGNEKTTAHGGELGEADVGQGVVADKGDVTRLDRGQVRSRERLEQVLVEANRAVNGLKRRDQELRRVLDGHVGNPLEAVERDIEVVGGTVGLQVKGAAEVSKRQVHGLQTVAVVDVQNLERSNIDTLETAEESVANDDALGVLNAGGAEGQGVKLAQGGPVDAVDALKRCEVKGRETDQVVEAEGTADGVEVISGESGDSIIILRDQVTLDLTESSEVDGTSGTLADDNVAGEGRARRSKGLSIGRGVDLNLSLFAAALGCRKILVSTHIVP